MPAADASQSASVAARNSGDSIDQFSRANSAVPARIALNRLSDCADKAIQQFFNERRPLHH